MRQSMFGTKGGERQTYPGSVALGERSAAVLECVVFHRLTARESAEELLKQSLGARAVRVASRYRLIDNAEELQSHLHIPRTATSFTQSKENVDINEADWNAAAYQSLQSNGYSGQERNFLSASVQIFFRRFCNLSNEERRCSE